MMQVIIDPTKTLADVGIVLGQKLGDQGVFGLVFNATYQGNDYILKIAENADKKMREAYRHEAKMGFLINTLEEGGEFFMRTEMYLEIGYQKSKNRPMLLLEKVGSGDSLFSWINQYVESSDQPFDERISRAIIFQMVYALARANSTIGFVHNDIKPSNIMIEKFITSADEDKRIFKIGSDEFIVKFPLGTPILKFIDFGGAVIVEPIKGIDWKNQINNLPQQLDVLLTNDLALTLEARENDADMISIFAIMTTFATSFSWTGKSENPFSIRTENFSDYEKEKFSFKLSDLLTNKMTGGLSLQATDQVYNILFDVAMRQELDLPPLEGEEFQKLEAVVKQRDIYAGSGEAFKKTLGEYGYMFMQRLFAMKAETRRAFGVVGMGNEGSMHTFANALYHPYFSFFYLKNLGTLASPGPELYAPLAYQPDTPERRKLVDHLEKKLNEWDKLLNQPVVVTKPPPSPLASPKQQPTFEGKTESQWQIEFNSKTKTDLIAETQKRGVSAFKVKLKGDDFTKGEETKDNIIQRLLDKFFDRPNAANELYEKLQTTTTPTTVPTTQPKIIEPAFDGKAESDWEKELMSLKVADLVKEAKNRGVSPYKLNTAKDDFTTSPEPKATIVQRILDKLFGRVNPENDLFEKLQTTTTSPQEIVEKGSEDFAQQLRDDLQNNINDLIAHTFNHQLHTKGNRKEFIGLTQRKNDHKDVPTIYYYLDIFAKIANDLSDSQFKKEWADIIKNTIIGRNWGLTGKETDNGLPIASYSIRANTSEGVFIKESKDLQKIITNFKPTIELGKLGYNVSAAKNKSSFAFEITSVTGAALEAITLMKFVLAVINEEDLTFYENLLDANMNNLLKLRKTPQNPDTAVVMTGYEDYLKELPGMENEELIP